MFTRIYPPFRTVEIQIPNYVYFMKSLSEGVLGHEDAVPEKVIFIGKIRLDRFRLRSAKTLNTGYPSFIVGKFNESRDVLRVGFDSNLKSKLLLLGSFLCSIIILRNHVWNYENPAWSIVVILWFPLITYILFLVIHIFQIRRLQSEIDQIIRIAKISAKSL